MNVQPKAAPGPNAQITMNSGAAKRAAAIAAFNNPPAEAAPTPPQPSPQTPESRYPVVNPNRISPEEMSAIVPPSVPTPEPISEEPGQTLSHEALKSEEVKAVDPAYEQLARRERALRAKARQQEAAFKAKEAALAAKEAELAAKAPDLSKYISVDDLKNQTLLKLAEAGISYDDITQAVLNQTPTDPRLEATISKLEAKIRQLEEANETVSKNMTAQQQAQYDAAVKQIRDDAKRLVDSDSNFETIKATNSVSDVVELIEETFKKDGTLLGVEEACQLVEDYLLEEAMKLTRIEKIKKRISQPAQAVNTPKTQQPAPKQPQAMKTLTNATSSQRPLSAKERAIMAFRGELK